MKKKILIIGGGIAGLSAAKSAREADSDCDITILESGSLNTYVRTRIPHYISGEASLKDMMPYGDEWYKKSNINLIKEIKVTGIDVNEKKVLTDKGSYCYDALIIASGASPFKPPIKGIDLPGIISIRTIDDADNAIKLAKNSKTCTIIGGGLLGLEMGWSIMQLECKVNIIEFGDRLLPRQTDNIASSLLLKALESRGFNIYLSAQTDEFLGTDAVNGVKLKDGRVIDTDFVILSTGVRANTSPFNSSGLDIGKAVKVDEYMRTNIGGIYAAGDAAEFNGNNFCIWPIAVSQGKAAGNNAAGKEIIYEDIKPHTQLKVHGITLFTIGDIFCESCDVLERYDEAEGKYLKFMLKDGMIAGAIVFGGASLPNKVKKAVESKKEFNGISGIDELIKML